MGGKLGKHNTYVVSDGAQGASYTSNIEQEEDRRDSEGSLYFLDEPVYTSAQSRRKSVFAEAYNPEEDDGDETAVVHPKTDEQRARLQERVQTCLLFRTLDVQQLAEVLDAIIEHKVKAEEMVIRQGDDGDYFYVIETGVYSALINTDAGPKKVFTYDNEGNFGELALLYNMPRAASIKVGDFLIKKKIYRIHIRQFDSHSLNISS